MRLTNFNMFTLDQIDLFRLLGACVASSSSVYRILIGWLIYTYGYIYLKEFGFFCDDLNLYST